MQFNITFKTIFEYVLKKLVLCIQIRFVSTEKTTRIASRASCFRKKLLLLSCATSVRLSVRPSVCPSVRLSSVEIISFRGNSLSNRPINLKIGLNVREGVVHVRKV